MEKTLKVDVVNAEESLFSGNAEFVALPGIEGELGILPGHTPLITLIRPGLVRIRKSAQDEEEKEAMEKAKAAAKTAASEIELAKVEAEIGMLAEQLRILQRIKH